MVMVKQENSNKNAIFAGWRVMPRPFLVGVAAVDWLCRVKYNFNQAIRVAESVKLAPNFRRVPGLADSVIHTKLSQDDR